MDQYVAFIPLGESSVGIPGHSFFIREARKQVTFEWLEGDPFVYTRSGDNEPVAMGVTDFLALHLDAERICRRIISSQLRRQYSGNVTPLGQVGDWRAIPLEDKGR